MILKVYGVRLTVSDFEVTQIIIFLKRHSRILIKILDLANSSLLRNFIYQKSHYCGILTIKELFRKIEICSQNGNCHPGAVRNQSYI